MSEGDVLIIKVGERYPARDPLPWPEGPHFNYSHGTHMLTITYHRPTTDEAAGVDHGPFEFALFEFGDVIFLLYRNGVLEPWQDAPYTFHLLRDAESRVLPDTKEGDRVLLHITLVCGLTGIVHAQRALTWSPEFTAAMHDAIRRQAERRWRGVESYDAQIREAYGRYPKPAAMAAAATHHTKGGA